MTEVIDRARAAFDRQAWRDAYDGLSAADEPLEPPDLERLASAAFLLGRFGESHERWLQAHRSYVEDGALDRAVRCAFWMAFDLLNGGDLTRGGGWVERAGRLLGDTDCVEAGYVRYVAALRAVFSGDVEAAVAGFAEAVVVGERFADPELCALARIGSGRCLIYTGQVATGLALLDEAMIAIEAQEISPIAVGDSYCTVIEGCQELFEVQRAGVWTAALSRWCDLQPELVLYRGQCLVHRAEIMQLHGEWSDAVEEIARACARLADPPGQHALGAASYLSGDLHRLGGRFPAAVDDYRRASELGRDPQPGIALLWLAQGRPDAAEAAIRRAVAEAEDPVTRVRLLGPFVEIVLVGGDLDAARDAAAELGGIAEQLGGAYLQALAGHGHGAVQLACGDPEAALLSLRRAWRGWRDLDAPYEAARTRVLVAAACRELGDRDGAEMELDAARSVFRALGAAPDLARTEPASATALPPGVTRREADVLALVATGRTNREIAAALVISEKTVASHIAHMFTKLGISSRSGLTAFAYENGVVSGRD